MVEKGTSEADERMTIERLEKRDWELWLLAVFIILILTLFIVVSYVGELSGSPREALKPLSSLNTYITASSLLVLIFSIYLLFKNLELRRLRKDLYSQKTQMEQMAGTLEEVTAFFQISTEINAKKDLTTILESICRESLNCLKANRATVFLMDSESGILKTQFSYAPNPIDEKLGLLEEKQVARKVLKQSGPLLLREPEDFADFFKYSERERKITSLLSIPLSPRGKSIGTLNVSLINEERKWNQEDLMLFSIFGNHASIAIENANLVEEVRREVSYRKDYEQCFTDILNRLQNLSEEERKGIEEHVRKLLPWRKGLDEQSFELETLKKVPGLEGPITLRAELGIERPRGDRVEEILRVNFADESSAETVNLSGGGVFIRTLNPMDLGEEFPLKLHVPDGQGAIEVVCKVIWANKYGKETKDSPRGMGVKFLNLSPEEKKRIEDFVKLQETGGPLPEEAPSAGAELAVKLPEIREPLLEEAPSVSAELGVKRPREDRVAEVLRVDFEDESSAETLNISGGGVFIKTLDPKDLGEKFPLKLHVPDGRGPVEVVCKVVWANKYGKETKESPRGMGVKFLDFDPEDKKRIEEFVKLQKTKGLLPEEDSSATG